MSSIYNNYFLSNKVKVFPCAYRNSTYDASARLNTEYNFTHLPHTIDKASYIIKFNDKSKSEPEAKLICVIQGYYFEIELGTGDYTTLQNKYLNICVASPNPPNGTDFIEGPHLCSWDSSDGVEATLDYKPEGSDYYIFKGLKIGEGALSNGSYQCYALKLDASAKLPIMANKIENIIKNKDSVENGTGKPISQEFTTETLSATTSISTSKLSVASNKLTVTSGNITANVPVTINNTLEVKDSTATTSILKAENDQVVINKPTNITGTTGIKGNIQISKSSSEAVDGNLIVAGTGNFGDKLTVTTGGADIAGATILKGTADITGKTTIGTGSAKTEIENNKIKSSEITADKINIKKALSTISIVIDKDTDQILKITGKDNDQPIFYVDTDSGKTYAKEINAKVEGISADAENVKTSINGKSITDIFETNGLVVQKASSLTATSSTDSAGNTIITGNTAGTVDALIPAKTEGRTYNIGSSDKTFDNIYATTFHGSLVGNASTAGEFKTAASITLTGNVISNTVSSTHGWTIETTIQNNAVNTDKIANSAVTEAKIGGGAVTTSKIASSAVTNAKLANNAVNTDKIADNAVTEAKIGGGAVTTSRIADHTVTNGKLAGNITNDKLINSSITIGGSSVSLGGTIGSSSDKKINGTLYVSTIEASDTITANTFNAKSDRRLKENIIDYKPEKSILDLQIKKFDFIDGPKNQIGCIAQDLKEICPEIVNENEKGYLSIQENKLVYLLLDEVKKLKNEVEKLKHK